MKRIFIESPCFGFGPISTSISLAKRLYNKYEVWFITYGEALLFLKKSTNFFYVEIDTRIETEFDKIKSVASYEDLFITNTNVEFSSYLIQNCYKVIVIDTLYWMWNSVPKLYSNYKFFVSQKYYGESVTDLPLHSECKPIINYPMWSEALCPDKKIAMISFGGMSEPGDNKYVISSARRMIECINDLLPEEITDVYVIGGLFKENEDPLIANRIHILGSVDTALYHKIAIQSQFTFMSPGLTSLYEMIYSKIRFCLLPGLNVSQVYQVYHFQKNCGYKYCIQWPDVERLTNHFNSVPELKGIDYLRDYICGIDIKKDTRFVEGVMNYIDDVTYDKWSMKPDTLAHFYKYPAIEDYVMSYLMKIENE